MDLVDYIKACRQTPTFPTAAELIVKPGVLGFNLAELVERSEAQVREIARVLTFNDGTGVVTASAETVGTPTTVEMNCAVASADPNYLGDIHNHPYRVKFGVGSAVGPSSGDLRQWLPNPGTTHIACHFVSSGPKLFVLIVRDATARVFDDLQMDNQVENYMNETMMNIGGDIPDPVSPRLGVWLETNAPGAKAEWQRMHEAMVIAQARRLHFEYFAGPFNGSLVTAKRLSPAVYERAWGQSENYRLTCSLCGELHGYFHSSAAGRWHACRACGRVYCDTCGEDLDAVPWAITRERQCATGTCNGRTRLIY